MDRLRLWILSLLLILTVVFVFRFSSILEMFLFSIAMAYILTPAVNGVEKICSFHAQEKARRNKKKTKKEKSYRGWAVLVVMLFMLLLIGIVIGLFFPYLSRQISGLMNELPQIHVGLQQALEKVNEQLAAMNLPQNITDPVQTFLNELDGYLLELALSAVSWLAQKSSGLVNLIIIIILQIYFLMDGTKMLQACQDYLLQNHLNRVVRFFQSSNRLISSYIKTQVMLSGGMALVALIGMKLLGIKYAGLFAVMLFVLDFIPYIGSIAGCGIVIAFALFTIGLKTAIATAIFVFILQQVEGNIVAPRLQGKLIGVHAAVIMLSLLICSELWGPVGMLFSVLIAGMVKLLLQDVLDYLLHPDKTIGAFLSCSEEEEHL